MAVEQGRPSGGNGFLYFAVGALIVAVGVLAWMYYSGQTTQSKSETAVERMADSVGDAADRVGDSARDAVQKLPEPAPVPAPAPTPAPTN
ncbi:MAG: hypothetical protein ABMA14_04370 [Hyphomonadaceae bacterium]